MNTNGECLPLERKMADNWRKLQLLEEKRGNQLRIKIIRK
jgi:hypothetical protein